MTKENANCCAVIVAAGNSTRMGLEVSKLLVKLNGVPAIIRTLSAFDEADSIASCVLVCRYDEIETFQCFIEEYRIRKVFSVVRGGKTRQQSVLAGIQAAPAEAMYFAVHDGARALVTPEEINLSVKDAVEFGASALAVPVKDTMKIVDSSGFVESTPERSRLWAVQTPQVFERRLYLKAAEQAHSDGADYTDDCQLVEYAGERVHLCRGLYTNIKLTTVDDISIAEEIIRNKEGSR